MKKLKFAAVSVVMATATAGSFAQWSAPADDVPAYHSAPPAKGVKLAPVLSGAQLSGPAFRYAWQKAVYTYAAKDSRVFYQLPCYCRCDRAMDHKSLRSCFEGTHGAECSTCAKEAVYAYRETLKGKTVAQIREGIEKKEFETIDLSRVTG